MDTKPFSQKVYPKFPKHGLSFLTEQLGLAKSKHRALADCIATKELYDNLKKFRLFAKTSWNYPGLYILNIKTYSHEYLFAGDRI